MNPPEHEKPKTETATSDKPATKKPSRWSQFVQAVGNAIGNAKFGG